MKRERLALFNTALGWVGVALTEQGIAWATLFHPSEAAALTTLQTQWPTADRVDAQSLPDLQDRLQRYARGERINFSDLTFDLSACKPFQQSVLKIVRAIPYGQTLTYAQVAHAIGKPKAARAVGWANSHNPVPLMIPCHRVVGSDGSLRGYGGVGGVETKRRLLALEKQGSR